MESTRSDQLMADFLGVDLTDRYASVPRPIDVCGLTLKQGSRLIAEFWKWKWPKSNKARLDISKIAQEVRRAKSTFLDGPQGLASVGETMRDCERRCGAVGKTPDTLPQLGRPFAGYIRSSVAIFCAFQQARIQVSPEDSGFMGGVSEVYPGDLWRRFAGRSLPRKSTCDGRRVRKEILKRLGVIGLPDLPTHDENDACIAAVLAAAAHGVVVGLSVESLGLRMEIDAEGAIREGPMIIPILSDEMRRGISQTLSDFLSIPFRNCRASVKSSSAPSVVQEATELRDQLVNCAREGNAQICSYKCASMRLFGNWSRAHARKVVQAAMSIPPADLPGLGSVRLDAFVVSSKTRLPGDGHWETANYEREDWERVLGTAHLLKS